MLSVVELRVLMLIFHHDDCRYSECHAAECHGVILPSFVIQSVTVPTIFY